MGRKKSDDELKRTTVQIPERTLAALAELWAHLTASEQIRLALDRYLFLAEDNDNAVNLYGVHCDRLARAIDGFEPEDFRKVARGLPALLAESEGPDAECVEDIRALSLVQRMILLDLTAAQRRDVTAQVKPGPA